MNPLPTHCSAQYLLDYFTGDYQKLTASEKAGIIAAFAAYLRGLGSRLGLQAVRGIRVQYNNGWKFACSGPADRGQTEVSVTALFLNLARRNEKLLFFRHYHGVTQGLKHYRGKLFSLERQSIKLLTGGEWRRLGRQATAGGGEYLCEYRKGAVILSVKSDEAARLVSIMLPDPQIIFDQGKPLSGRGLGCASVRIEIDGLAYFLKRYDDKGIIDSCIGLYKKSRGMRVWRTGWGGIHRGLPLARPIVLIEETKGCLVGRSWLVTEFLEGTTPLMKMWPALTAFMKNDLLISAAILLGRMHCYGLLHGDTNWDNLLVREGEGRPQLLLVDLDCGRITTLNDSRAFRDIQHFVRDLMRAKNAGVSMQRDFFVAVWKRWFFPRNPRARCFLQGFRYRNAKTG